MPHKLPEDRARYLREWRNLEKNLEKDLERRRRYTEEHREHYKERARIWRIRNRYVCKLARVYGLTLKEARKLFGIPRVKK